MSMNEEGKEPMSAQQDEKAEAPKKKNIIQVVRPQNATTKEGKNYGRSKQQRPARQGDRPQGER
ncbi:MAG: hypothetical protein MJ116_10135, partial [Lachnospiraceae bacterium]|nr:hypothetical protein [Lachnospiraceae bacterium]